MDTKCGIILPLSYHVYMHITKQLKCLQRTKIMKSYPSIRLHLSPQLLGSSPILEVTVVRASHDLLPTLPPLPISHDPFIPPPPEQLRVSVRVIPPFWLFYADANPPCGGHVITIVLDWLPASTWVPTISAMWMGLDIESEGREWGRWKLDAGHGCYFPLLYLCFWEEWDTISK